MAFPVIIPLAVGALVLAGCAKVANDVRKARPLASLEGSEWGPENIPALEQFVAFKSGGEVRGFGGCNQFFGQYSQEGQTLTIGALASTKKACPEGMEAESTFLKTLQDTRKIEATHVTLRLLDADGQELMQLRRRDWD